MWFLVCVLVTCFAFSCGCFDCYVLFTYAMGCLLSSLDWFGIAAFVCVYWLVGI